MEESSKGEDQSDTLIGHLHELFSKDWWLKIYFVGDC